MIASAKCSSKKKPVMGKAAYRLKIYEIIGDYEPHTLNELVEKVGFLVPAGQAYRRTEGVREARRRHQGNKGKMEHLPEVTVVIGIRRLVNDELNALKSRGKIAKWKDGDDIYVQKMRP